MQLIIRMFHRSDLSRSRAMVQELADESIKARRKLDETERNIRLHSLFLREPVIRPIRYRLADIRYTSR